MPPSVGLGHSCVDFLLSNLKWPHAAAFALMGTVVGYIPLCFHEIYMKHSFEISISQSFSLNWISTSENAETQLHMRTDRQMHTHVYCIKICAASSKSLVLETEMFKSSKQLQGFKFCFFFLKANSTKQNPPLLEKQRHFR